MESYFVSYSFRTKDGFGFGNMKTVMNGKITDINVVEAVAASVERDNGFEKGSVVILNFQRFDT